ncbi:MAG: futalosine hydrolase [Bacteroidales bacterium]|nr:futalosine hydrolase [Bacteroidales bacterium]
MNLLLVAATTFEIRPLLDKLTFIGEVDPQLSRYTFKKINLDVLIPGVGMMLTAFQMGKSVAARKYDLAINAGIAGTFNKTLHLGSLVQVTEDCISELGAEDGEKFLSFFDLGLMDPDDTPYVSGALINQSPPTFACCRLLPKVKGITVNTVHGAAGSVALIIKRFKADVESMEGAAFLYACLAEKIPCLQLRAISNYVEERDKSRWNIELALKNLNKTLFEIIKEISS